MLTARSSLCRLAVQVGRPAQRAAGSLTVARRTRQQSLFSEGQPPLLWCPVLAHYKDDGALDVERMSSHQSWLVSSGVTGFLVPGSTGDAWDMNMDEAISFLDTCRGIASKIRSKNPGSAPYLLAGALHASEEDTLKCMELMEQQAKDDICGFCVCPPRGITDEGQMEKSLSAFLDKGFPIAVYQLPQVTQVTMSVDLLRRLADKYETFLFFKDSSGEDAMALSGVGLDGVFMVRGAEGKYAEWLANPISSGYHGFLLSTANVYPSFLASVIGNVAAGAAGGDLIGAAELSARISRCTEVAFAAVTGELAEGLGGNAFTNSAKAVDHWMAWGPGALEQQRPLPLLKSGKRLPSAVIEKVGEALVNEKLMGTSGYLN